MLDAKLEIDLDEGLFRCCWSRCSKRIDRGFELDVLDYSIDAINCYVMTSWQDDIYDIKMIDEHKTISWEECDMSWSKDCYLEELLYM
jgi:hypothetical protein